MSEIHKDEIRTTLGITDYQQGGTTVQRKATEAQIITSAATLRVEEKRDIISDFVIEIVRRLAAMFQEFDDEYDYLPISDEELDEDFAETLKKEYGFNPKLPFIGISREHIQGEFEFSFNVEDMIQQPKEVRAASLGRSMQAVGSNALFTQKFVEYADVTSVIVEMFELNGVDIKKFRKGGPSEIPAVVENKMFENGLEVPDPHRHNDDDEHLIIHGTLRRELEAKLQELQGQIQKLQAGMQMIPQMMATDPQNAQMVKEKAMAQVNQLQQQAEPLEQALRRLKLHMQKTVQQVARKSGDEALAGGGGVAPVAGQGGAPSPVAMAKPAQAPGPGTVV